MMNDPPNYRPMPPPSQNEQTNDLLALMKECWADSPNERPAFTEIAKALRHINKGKKLDMIDSMMKKLEMHAENLEMMVNRRTVELEGEKQKTDLLLYRMLPRYVADELKVGRRVEPEMFESATVYFSDIAGFVDLSSESTPFQIVELLNDLYSLFDETIVRFDVYKVETIGDAYMVVSGLPTRNEGRHIIEICNLALAILDGSSTFKIRHRPNHQLKPRIGIHTGTCAAGVVGHATPRYCLFGDTVNVASRMESTGEAQRIHLSDAANKALKRFPGYITELRGETLVKGKGMMETFWLVGKDKHAENEALKS